MLEVSDDDFQTAMLESISAPGATTIQPPTEESKAPYFTDWLRQQIVDKYGAGQAFGGGLQIKSTLDLGLQNAADQAVSDRLAGLGPDRGRGRDRQRHRRGAGDGRRPGLRLELRSTSPPTASASPAPRSSRSRWSPRSTRDQPRQNVDLRPGRRSRSRRRSARRTARRRRSPTPSGSATTTTTTSAPPRSTTATTYSDNSVYAQLGLEVGPNKIVKTAHDLGITTKVPTTTRR